MDTADLAPGALEHVAAFFRRLSDPLSIGPAPCSGRRRKIPIQVVREGGEHATASSEEIIWKQAHHSLDQRPFLARWICARPRSRLLAGVMIDVPRCPASRLAQG